MSAKRPSKWSSMRAPGKRTLRIHIEDEPFRVVIGATGSGCSLGWLEGVDRNARWLTSREGAAEKPKLRAQAAGWHHDLGARDRRRTLIVRVLEGKPRLTPDAARARHTSVGERQQADP
jgi:hypothetical protein